MNRTLTYIFVCICKSSWLTTYKICVMTIHKGVQASPLFLVSMSRTCPKFFTLRSQSLEKSCSTPPLFGPNSQWAPLTIHTYTYVCILLFKITFSCIFNSKSEITIRQATFNFLIPKYQILRKKVQFLAMSLPLWTSEVDQMLIRC